MSTVNLPTREDVSNVLDMAVITAYRERVLMTREEFIDSLDMEAAGYCLNDLVKEGHLAKTTKYLEWEWSTRIVEAALGKGIE